MYVCMYIVVDDGCHDVVETCVALYTYNSTVANDLSFNKGDVITIIKEDGEWWSGSKDGRTGTFPANYVKKLAPASKVNITVLCRKNAVHSWN